MPAGLNRTTVGDGSGGAIKPRDSSASGVVIRPGTASIIATFGKLPAYLALKLEVPARRTEPVADESAVTCFLTRRVPFHQLDGFHRLGCIKVGALGEFPKDALLVRFHSEALPPQSAELTLCLLKYLNLCSEEYYLWQHKYLAKTVWAIWEKDLKKMIASPLLQREWPVLKKEFESHLEFLVYVEDHPDKAQSAETSCIWGENMNERSRNSPANVSSFAGHFPTNIR